jgi:hypothetical protein
MQRKEQYKTRQTVKLARIRSAMNDFVLGLKSHKNEDPHWCQIAARVSVS